MTSKKKWPGILAKPIEMPPLGSLLISAQERSKIYSDQHLERLMALFDYYDADSLERLFFRMIDDCIPGFKIKYLEGPKGWRGTEGIELFADVQYLVRQGRGERQACKILETQKRFSPRYGGRSNLWARYMEVKRSHWLVPKLLLSGDAERQHAMSTIAIEQFALFKLPTKEKP